MFKNFTNVHRIMKINEPLSEKKNVYMILLYNFIKIMSIWRGGETSLKHNGI